MDAYTEINDAAKRYLPEGVHYYADDIDVVQEDDGAYSNIITIHAYRLQGGKVVGRSNRDLWLDDRQVLEVDTEIKNLIELSMRSIAKDLSE